MVKVLIDTCVLVDHLNGRPEAHAEIASHVHPAISRLTWMEVLAGAPDHAIAATRRYLDGYEVVEIGESVAEIAASIRRNSDIGLGDALTMACARAIGGVLVTRNKAVFTDADPAVRIPYE
ncbi:PIN domain-containing protein [Oryzibacter oryziterrae]|uniref:PIN domain-containing protein n=1 Tax=Oryzibacter oryziterrae TaxID=2766474 RepID=UPI001F201517|nr:PIN domain-containing protein [Oryzibacter oryziterrae]